MRRKDREITDPQALQDILRRCDSCVIALNDDGSPYLFPVNFGFEDRDGQWILYFHGAGESKKHNLIRKDPRASFTMHCDHELFTDPIRGMCTMRYRSVCGRGRIESVGDREKERALAAIMRQYDLPDFKYDPDSVPLTTVFRLVVEEMTGKANSRS